MNKASDFHSTLNKRLKSGVDDAVNCVMQVMAELHLIHGSGAGLQNSREAFEQALQDSMGRSCRIGLA